MWPIYYLSLSQICFLTSSISYVFFQEQPNNIVVIDEVNIVYIYDWEKAVLLCESKVEKDNFNYII